MNNTTDQIVPVVVVEINYVYVTFLLLISTPLITITIFGNILVILSWVLHKYVRTPQNAYFLSLAISDFLVGIFVFPFTISYGFNKCWTHGLTLCQIWLVGYFSLCPISAYHLVVIAVDRYRTVTEGVSYLQRRSIRTVVETVGVIWILGLLVVMPMVLNWDHLATDPKAEKQCITKKLPYWVVHVVVMFLGLPMFLLSRLYWKVYKKIQKRFRKRLNVTTSDASRDHQDFSKNQSTEVTDDNETSKGSMSEEPEPNQLKVPPSIQVMDTVDKKANAIAKERRAAVTLGIIIGAFFICWLPWYSLTVYDMLVPVGWKPYPFLFSWSAILGYSNSCINPIIYAFRNPEFREAFQKILKRRW